MKTEELIEWLDEIPAWYELLDDGKVLKEIIKRLEELEELRERLKEITYKMKDYADRAIIKELLMV